jgi:hypothetical protein
MQGPSKEDVLKKIESLMEEYLRSGNVQDALSSYREQKIPDRFVRHVLLAIMTHTLDKNGKASTIEHFRFQKQNKGNVTQFILPFSQPGDGMLG